MMLILGIFSYLNSVSIPVPEGFVRFMVDSKNPFYHKTDKGILLAEKPRSQR
jgi:hypothetical protein